MSGANGQIKPVKPESMHRRAFQRVAADTIDIHAQVIDELRQKVQAQGEYMADRAVDLDQVKTDLAAGIDNAGWAVAQCKDNGRKIEENNRDTLKTLEYVFTRMTELHQDLLDVRAKFVSENTFSARLRWLVTGK